MGPFAGIRVGVAAKQVDRILNGLQFGSTEQLTAGGPGRAKAVLLVAQDPLHNQHRVAGVDQMVSDRLEAPRRRASLKLAVADSRDRTARLADVRELGEVQDLVGLGGTPVGVVRQLFGDQ